MANKRAGATGGEDRVSFTRSAAQRIADVVRHVEQGSRDTAGPITSPRMAGGGGNSIKLVTFTGAWAIGGTKTCTVKGSTTEIEVVNLFHQIGADCGERDAAVARVSGQWILLVPECSA